LQTVLSAFRVLPTIPQTFPHFWIQHFTFCLPQFRILPITLLDSLQVRMDWSSGGGVCKYYIGPIGDLSLSTATAAG